MAQRTEDRLQSSAKPFQKVTSTRREEFKNSNSFQTPNSSHFGPSERTRTLVVKISCRWWFIEPEIHAQTQNSLENLPIVLDGCPNFNFIVWGYGAPYLISQYFKLELGAYQ